LSDLDILVNDVNLFLIRVLGADYQDNLCFNYLFVLPCTKLTQKNLKIFC